MDSYKIVSISISRFSLMFRLECYGWMGWKSRVSCDARLLGTEVRMGKISLKRQVSSYGQTGSLIHVLQPG